MKTDDYRQIMEILLEINEDMGEMKADLKATKILQEETSQTVKKHDQVISNWQGRIAVIGAIVGVVSTSVISWVKRELGI